MVVEESLSSLRMDFIEKIGLVAQGDGLPRIAGRMMALMVFDHRPYSFSELATKLQVSRGSISSNAKLLESLGVIERVAKPGDRQDYFKLADNPYEASLRLAIERQRKAAYAIQKIIDKLPPDDIPLKRRLTDLSSFYDAVAEGINHATRKL